VNAIYSGHSNIQYIYMSDYYRIGSPIGINKTDQSIMSAHNGKYVWARVIFLAMKGDNQDQDDTKLW